MKNIYFDKGRTHREFKVVEHVFLKFKSNRSSLILGSCPKLGERYYGPFEFLERIHLFEYILALPTSMRTHNMFLFYLLNKYRPNINHVIDWNMIQVEHEGDFQVDLVHILGWKSKVLWNKYIILIKV